MVIQLINQLISSIVWLFATITGYKRRRIGRQNPFNRLNEELFSICLSYLPLEDRFRCQTVSKRWRRVLLKKQKLLVYHKHIDDKHFEFILKKCPNIATIVLFTDNRLILDSKLDLIIKHCQHLHTIELYTNTCITRQLVDQFFAKFGNQLIINPSFCWTRIVGEVWHSFKTNIMLCHNIIKFNVDTKIYDDMFVSLFCLNNNTLYPNLREISINYSHKVMNEFKVFVDNYKNQMKAIQISAFKCDKHSIEALVNGLSQMNQLIDLNLYNTDPFELRHLLTIGSTVEGLKSLSVNLDFNVTVEEWICFSHTFRQLNHLTLSGRSTPSIHIKGLLMNELTHLTIILDNCQINDYFWSTIATQLPKLHYIHITQNIITDSVLNGLSLVPKLKHVRLDGRQDYSQQVVQKLVDKLHSIVLPN